MKNGYNGNEVDIMWDILGISPTNNEEEIKTAYRMKLVHVNPEDDPKGFQHLREAYEQACLWAQKQKKKKNPLEQWIQEVENIYTQFYRRIDPEEWEEVFEQELCVDLDTFEETRLALLYFLMGHSFLPQTVWQKIFDVFELEEDREFLKEKVSNDFLSYIEICAQEKEYFDYQLYEGPYDADYDSYIKILYLFRAMLEQENIKKAEELLDPMIDSVIYHPYAKAEMIRYYLFVGKDLWKPLWEELREELYEDPVLTEIEAEILLCEKKYQEAEKLFLKGQNEDRIHIYTNRKLVQLYMETGEYEKGKKVCLKALDGKYPDEKICQYMIDLNRHLIQLWKQNEEKKLDLAWCYYQNQEFSNCLCTLQGVKKEEIDTFDYYNLMARVLLETGDYEQGLKMTRIWISNIEHLTGKEADYERKKKRYGFAHFIASMHCLELGMKEQSERYFRKAVDLDPDRIDMIMYRERRMETFLKIKEYEECIKEANRTIEESEFFYLAYVYRQTAHYHLYHVQQVIDDFYHATDIDPEGAKPYVTAVKMLMELNYIQDAGKILEIGKKNGIRDAEFQFYFLDYERRKESDPKRIEKLAEQMSRVLKNITGEKGDYYYEMGLIYGLLSEKLGDENKIKKAMEYAKAAVRENDETIEYLWLMADLYKKDQNYEEAIFFYRKILHIDDTLQDVWLDLGNAYERCGNLDEAILVIEKNVFSTENHPYIHNMLMNLYLKRFQKSRKKTDFDQGIFHADQQLKIIENDYFYRERAYFYIEDMKLQEALEDIRKSYELNPKDLYALSSMGYIYYLMGMYEKAIFYYRLAEKQADTSEKKFSLYRVWGCIYERNGQFEEAFHCYVKCLMIRPDSIRILERIGDIFMRCAQYNKAGKYYEKAIEKTKRATPDLMIKTARAYHYGKNRIKEKKILKQTELNFGYRSDVKCKIAKFYLEEKQNIKKAYQYYAEACDGQNEYPYIHLVEIYARMGKRKEVQKMCDLAEEKIKERYGSMEEYIRCKGYQKDIYYDISMMYYYSRKIDDAVDYHDRMKEKPMCTNCPYGFCYKEQFLEALFFALRGEKEKSIELCRRILDQDQNLDYVRYFMNKLEKRNKQ